MSRNLSFLILLLFTLSFSFAQLEKQQVRVINGFEASCDSGNEALVNNNRPIIINILDSKKIGASYSLKLELIFVKCEKNKWQPSAQQDFRYLYTDSIGQKLEETLLFSKFKFEVFGKNEALIYSSELPVEGKSKHILSIKINSRDAKSDRGNSNKKYIEVSLSADKTRQNAADIEPSLVNWGKLKFYVLN